MLVDASTLPWANEAFLGAKLARDAAVAHPFVDELFAMLDAIVVGDPRLQSAS